ncbi:MAG: YgdI/YgdR family lipoprotein [Oscillospiraceae bacterium]|nr:YgdI/YgdR family lipoprotein [Oscillospiraceae bacterium]
MRSMVEGLPKKGRIPMKHTFKKLLSILLAVAMLLTLAGCQFVEDPEEDTDDEVVGGGLIQARDGEEIDDAEDEVVEEEEIAQLELMDMSNYIPDGGASFYALVVSVGSNSLNVCGLNTTVNGSSQSGLFTVSLRENAKILKGDTEISLSDLTAGDIVFILYSGEVMDTYPAQISDVVNVYYDTHANRLAEIEYLLPDGYEDFGEFFPAWDDFEY